MSLPNSSTQIAVSEEKKNDCRRAGAAVLALARAGLRPRDIMTKKAFENAITVVIALGGSTNAVLHLLAIAHAAKVKLTIDDFTRIGKRVPVLADLKPSGKHLMSEVVAIGGIRPLMKMLLDKKLLHGDALTVTGETLAETLADTAYAVLKKDGAAEAVYAGPVVSVREYAVRDDACGSGRYDLPCPSVSACR